MQTRRGLSLAELRLLRAFFGDLGTFCRDYKIPLTPQLAQDRWRLVEDMVPSPYEVRTTFPTPATVEVAGSSSPISAPEVDAANREARKIYHRLDESKKIDKSQQAHEQTEEYAEGRIVGFWKEAAREIGERLAHDPEEIAVLHGVALRENERRGTRTEQIVKRVEGLIARRTEPRIRDQLDRLLRKALARSPRARRKYRPPRRRRGQLVC